jgi:DNA mismatch endonuclease Vsr
MVRPSRRPFADVAETRRKLMRKIRDRDTGPERRVRSMLHQAGYRFRKHAAELPGKPDVVFKARRKAIFVHGCFWHHHSECRAGSLPRTRTDYWQQKLERTVTRDKRNISALESQGWQVLVIWECDLRDRPEKVKSKLHTFLGPTLYCPRWPAQSE